MAATLLWAQLAFSLDQLSFFPPRLFILTGGIIPLHVADGGGPGIGNFFFTGVRGLRFSAPFGRQQKVQCGFWSDKTSSDFPATFNRHRMLETGIPYPPKRLTKFTKWGELLWWGKTLNLDGKSPAKLRTGQMTTKISPLSCVPLKYLLLCAVCRYFILYITN